MSIHLNEFCKMLLGEKLIGVYRACDMICFDFGKFFEKKNYKGEIRLASTKALHILSHSFRVRCGNKVVLSTEDLEDPISEEIAADWSKVDTTFFDSAAKDLMSRHKNEVVQKVVISDGNDISIYTNNLCITAFVTDSGRDYHSESWRLFERIPEDSPHLVVNGVGAWLGDDDGVWICGGEVND